MLKRQKFISIILCISILLVFSKCAYLMLKPYFTDENLVDNTFIMKVAESRGNIYDRNGEKLVNDEKENTLLIEPTDSNLILLKNNLKTEDFLEIQQKLLRGLPTKISVKQITPYNDDIIQLETYKRYSEKNILRHILGYLDMNGEGVCGIEKSFESLLSAKKRQIIAKFSVTATGVVLVGDTIKIEKNDYYTPNGVQLTIDKDIQTICEEAMESFNVEKGAVVVLDVDTFKILAMVSRPTYDPDNVESSLNNENSPLINRAISPYSTGSVFKIAIAATALEEKLDKKYYCTGKIQIGDIIFNCHDENGHGLINLADAVSQSCNTYFINLTKDISKEKIIENAKTLGFGESISLCEEIVSSSGNLPSVDELDSPAALANLSFGQGVLTSTPLQIAAMTATVANSGSFIHSSLIEGVVDGSGLLEKTVQEAPNKVLSDGTCEFLKKAMIKAVEEGTGKKAKPINTSAGVKTSTAENSDGSYNSWVTGFFPSDKPQYAVSILKEDGISGGEDCGPIFKRIAEKITLLSR